MLTVAPDHTTGVLSSAISGLNDYEYDYEYNYEYEQEYEYEHDYEHEHD